MNTPTPPNSSPAATEGPTPGNSDDNNGASFLKAEILRLREYAFGMESALRGARASGTASELSMWAAECAELRMQNSELRERLARYDARIDELLEENARLISTHCEDKKALIEQETALSALRQELSAARGDKELLDWLTGNGYACIVQWTHGIGNRWFIMDPSTGSRVTGDSEYETARQAIRVAMQSPAKGEQ